MNDSKSANIKMEEINISVKTQLIAPVVDSLLICQANTYILYLKTQGYHWNVVGPNFAALHLFFETLYIDLAEASDTLAERVRALGHRAPASFAEFTKLAQIEETSSAITTEQMIRNLTADNEKMARLMKNAVTVAQTSEDEGTADMLIGRIKQHEKNAWMLRSLQS